MFSYMCSVALLPLSFFAPRRVLFYFLQIERPGAGQCREMIVSEWRTCSARAYKCVHISAGKYCDWERRMRGGAWRACPELEVKRYFGELRCGRCFGEIGFASLW